MSTIADRPARILVIDDEPAIRRALNTILRSRGYRLLFAEDGQSGLASAIDKSPDLIVLDLALPDRSGLEVCRELRSWTEAPILVLSVRSEEADKIAALYEGADDYLTKPFHAGELLARVHALLRRAAQLVSPPPVVRSGDLEVDIARRRVALAGRDVALTPTEFEILSCLVRNAGVVVSHTEIIEKVWISEVAASEPGLRVHVSNLRRKLEPATGSWRFILTEPGVGFRFNAAPENETRDVRSSQAVIRK
jgi:two-component system KDP operon response regulator KdpE